MFAAARELDQATHDMITPSGPIGLPLTGPCAMGHVVIENQPAAHVGCSVVCSGATAVAPAHPPVPLTPPAIIAIGSATVLVHSSLPRVGS